MVHLPEEEGIGGGADGSSGDVRRQERAGPGGRGGRRSQGWLVRVGYKIGTNDFFFSFPSGYLGCCGQAACLMISPVAPDKCRLR